MKTKKTKLKKELTTEQIKRRRMKARERHWRKTGVSEATIAWMIQSNML